MERKKMERTFARTRGGLRIGELGGIGSMIRPSDDYMEDTYRITTYSMIMLR